MEQLANQSLEKNGFCQFPSGLAPDRLEEIARNLDEILTSGGEGVLESRGTAYGIRNLIQLWPEVASFVELPLIRDFVTRELGSQCGLVRGMLFDKPPARTWTLPWHRDRTIAVQSIPDDLGDFRNPTLKAGVTHLTAPRWLLEQMLTLRLSIDPMTPENGPLVVLPGSHRSPAYLAVHNHAARIVGSEMIDHDDGDLKTFDAEEVRVIECEAGEVFVMRPLLAHSSLNSAPENRLRRRIIHLEFCAVPTLPRELQWKQFLPLAH